MDLTKNFPASARETMLGIVQLRRTLDKAKAAAAGTLGEYNFNCGMDRYLFNFLGIDHEALLDVVKSANGDNEIEKFVAPYVHAKSDDEIAKFNAEWLVVAPQPGTPQFEHFMQIRNAVAPDRTDVTAWVDVLDLEEGREVPRRVAA